MAPAPPSALLTAWQVFPMGEFKIRQVFEASYQAYSAKAPYLSDVQRKAAHSILKCKSPSLGCNVSRCDCCGHMVFHNNSCRNRSCPDCQAVLKEIWADKRRAEVIDSPYFHVVFTLPHELGPLFYHNQKLLYGLFHRCCAQTLLELASSRKYLGAVPGIIQVLHTWNQELSYHVHMHCIVSGGGLTKDHKIRLSSNNFFIPVRVLRDKFKGKFMACLSLLYKDGSLVFPSSCSALKNPCSFREWKDSLYAKDWCPYIKETFNGFGNAIEYLGRYTHRIAVSNSRLLSVSRDSVSFSARGLKPGGPKRTITLDNIEFIRRYLMHVLPSGFQKIRYYGFLNNRMKTHNLTVIFKLQGGQRFRQRYAGMTMTELLKAVWNFDIRICPECGCASMKQLGRMYAPSG